MVYSIVRFPSQWMVLLLRNIKSVRPEGPYEFRVAPSMTKIEIREYLTKVYNVKVHEVRTAVFLGKYRRPSPLSPRKTKEPDWKKAWVTLDVPASASEAPLRLE